MKAIWSGALGFGLINIPVKIYSGSRDRALKFRMLDKHDHCEISYKKVCRSDNKTVDQKDIVKGYEYEKGQYVILTPEDFKAANAKKTSMIEIESFARKEEIEPKYYDKPYYLEPDTKSVKAYVLLREALKKSGDVGIARYVLKDREHIGMITAEDNVLCLIQLRFEEEIIKPEDIKAPSHADFTNKEMDMALSLVESLRAPFKPSNFKDAYAEDLRRLINEKVKGAKPRKKTVTLRIDATDATDILDMLRKSLDRELSKK